MYFMNINNIIYKNIMFLIAVSNNNLDTDINLFIYIYIKDIIKCIYIIQNFYFYLL